MDRRQLLVVLGAGALAAPLTCFAQLQGKVWRIGMLDTVSANLNATNLDAFRQGMRDLGYVEGRNLIIESARPMAWARASLRWRRTWLV